MTDRHRSGERRRGSGGLPEQSSREEGRPSPEADRPTPLRIPSPVWTPTDDVIGAHADRQILVVGATPTGFTLTHLLAAAGYEPLLVSGDPVVTSRCTYLSPAAVEVLGTLDLGARLHNCGVAADGVAVRRIDGAESSDPVAVLTAGAPNRTRAPPVVVPTPMLLRTLRDAMPAAATVQNRAVGAISRRATGVAVTFDDGVREPFDVVVDVGARSEPLRSDGRGADSVFRQYEAVVDSAAEGREFRDVWAPEAVAQRLPGVGDRDLVRITLPAHGDDGRDAREVFSDLRWVPDSGAFGRRRVTQRRLPGGGLPEGWWGDGRIARCGPAACPAAPATGVDQSLGITDALGLASALTRDVDAGTAVDTYAAVRAQRLDGLRRTVARGDSRIAAPHAADTPFDSLRVLRAIALEPFFGIPPEPLGASVPG